MLSTCNRTEVYVVAERFHGAFADVRNFFGELAFLPPEGFADHLYVHFDDEAVHAPVRGGVGPRLRRGRRGRDPRPGPRPRGRRAQDEGLVRPAAQHVVPPRARGRQAGAHRHRHLPPHRPRCPAPRSRWSPIGCPVASTGATHPRARRRRGRHRHGAVAGRVGARPTCSSPTAPSPRPKRSGRLGRRSRLARSTRSADALEHRRRAHDLDRCDVDAPRARRRRRASSPNATVARC